MTDKLNHDYYLSLDLVKVFAEVGSEVSLHPLPHGTEGWYNEVVWIKGPENLPIASYGSRTDGHVRYYDDYCPGENGCFLFPIGSPCKIRMDN